MKTEHPLLSLAMIARDASDVIGDAIASVQSVVGDVVVVLDHRTRDNTREIAESYEGKGKIDRVKVVDYEWNHHFGDARSVSLAHCVGKWIIWLDCDERVVEVDLPNLVEACEAEKALMLRSLAIVDASYDGPQEDVQGFGIGSKQPRPRAYRNYVTAYELDEDGQDDDVEPHFVPIEEVQQDTELIEYLEEGDRFCVEDDGQLRRMKFENRPRYRFRVHEGVTFPGGDFKVTHDHIDMRVHHVGSDNPFKSDYYYALQVIASRDDPQEAHYAIYLAGRICREGHPVEALMVLDAADMRTISTVIQLQRYWVVRGKCLHSMGLLLEGTGSAEGAKRATRYYRMAIDVFGEAGCAAGRLHAAVMMIDQGLIEVAVEVLREAVTIDPEHLQLKGMLAITETHLHNKKELTRRCSYYLGMIGQGHAPDDALKAAMGLEPLRDDPDKPKPLSAEDAADELRRRRASVKADLGDTDANRPTVVDRALRGLNERQGLNLDLDKLVGGKRNGSEKTDGDDARGDDGGSDGNAAAPAGDGERAQASDVAQGEGEAPATEAVAPDQSAEEG